ncbi:MAG: hypothetical protein QOE27_1330 [Solirubrobacteraceae bacterium]|nr:hypothetical protein [Solirubrobacteraceae bacterium]
MINKTLNDQVAEIRKLLSDAQGALDQVGYALRALQDRLEPPRESVGPPAPPKLGSSSGHPGDGRRR